MSIIKKTKDYIIKLAFGDFSVPRGLFELNKYFRLYGPINFNIEKQEDRYIAVSTNYKWGSIITEGSTPEDLDANIKDAILTSFEVPSSYSGEAAIHQEGSKKGEKEYALA